MLRRLAATRFDLAVESAVGRTRPCLVAGEDAEGRTYEVVLKLRANCERGATAMVAEAVAALLAVDLGILIPQPHIVEISPEFPSIVPDTDYQILVARSVGPNFGSLRLHSSISTATCRIPVPLVQQAVEVLAFDLLICNVDRRADKPNCLFDGRQYFVIDHELAFLTEGLWWHPPWEITALEGLRADAKRHLFYEGTRNRVYNLDRLLGALQGVSKERVKAYRDAMPVEWIEESSAANSIFEYIEGLALNADMAMKHIVEAIR